ncbi:unnamed protein product [Pseudo-nitzschia multistriata]|uniref:Phosphoglycerate mutase (2,3-diphosphoglycerate-dependent) n=1 Tax=Pseudo-nitzschia multistriata TaxID=183589 RepID=A0A448Z8T5_9STRA|nr:unnamed protein product [Pseudo-nitzschia multistriata]
MSSWDLSSKSRRFGSISRSARSFFRSSSRSSSRSGSRNSSVRSAVSSDDGIDHAYDTATKKTIYLIRHAESEENVHMHGMQELGTSLVGGRVPTSENLSSSLKFIGGVAKGDIDSKLSEGGREQVKELHSVLKSDGMENMSSVINDVDIIGHSPLVRARDTCYGGFGLHTNGVCENVVELKCLEEATPWETAVQGRKKTVHKRIDELQRWIDNQTDATTIALVGHSEYFMIMLGISRAEKFWNCDVWKVEYAAGKWTGLTLKHRLTSSKPMGVF